MGKFAIADGHKARWLLGSVELLAFLESIYAIDARKKRVMRKFALRLSPDGAYILFKTSDQWLAKKAPSFIQNLEWSDKRPTLGKNAQGEEIPWLRAPSELDQILGKELDDDHRPLDWEL